jgi:hypothetical protein
MHPRRPTAQRQCQELLSGALTEIRKRQQQEKQERVRSAKAKREKRIVRDRFAGQLPPPRRKEIAMAKTYCEISVVTYCILL